MKWYEGSNDPLDRASELRDDESLVADHGKLSVPVERQRTSQETEAPKGPLDILIECEALDEEAGCACGTHLEEHRRYTKESK